MSRNIEMMSRIRQEGWNDDEEESSTTKSIKKKVFADEKTDDHDENTGEQGTNKNEKTDDESANERRKENNNERNDGFNADANYGAAANDDKKVRAAMADWRVYSVRMIVLAEFVVVSNSFVWPTWFLSPTKFEAWLHQSSASAQVRI